MSLHIVQWCSNILQKNTVMRVLVPDGEGPFATVYLLHGLTEDSSVWARFHQIELLMRDKPFIVVMPDADRSFYVNDPRSGGLEYENYMMEDVLGYVERVFPAAAESEQRALVGISMGGDGALLLAFRHPDAFCATASISGSTYYAHDMSTRHLNNDVGALGRALPRESNDLFFLAAHGDLSSYDLALRLSCGLQDHLYDTNLAFHAHLARLGVDHQWVEHKGRHDHSTWDSQLPLALDFVVAEMEANRHTLA